MSLGRCVGTLGPLEFFLVHGGVMVFGSASRVWDDSTKHRVMQALFEKHAPHLESGVDYKQVRGDNRASLPWIRTDMHPLTKEWQSSRD
jgi:hypothetical protein